MTSITRFTPFIPTKNVEGPVQQAQQGPQDAKVQDTPEKTTGTLHGVMQPNAKATRAKLLQAMQGVRQTATKENTSQAEDPIAQAATAGTFNPFMKNVLKDSTVIGFGGLTYGEERELFEGISVGMKSIEELATEAHQYLLDKFVPSRSVGF